MAEWPLCTAAGSQGLDGEAGCINRMAVLRWRLDTTGVEKDQESIEHGAICVFVNITCVSALLGIGSRKLHLFQNINRTRGKKRPPSHQSGRKKDKTGWPQTPSLSLHLGFHPSTRFSLFLDVFSASAYDTSNLETDFLFSHFSYPGKVKASGALK